MNKTSDKKNQLNENLQWMKTYMPAIWRQLQLPPQYPIQVKLVETQNEWNCSLQWENGKTFYLHSRMNQPREFQKMIEDVREEHSAAVIFGCGSADFLKKLATECPQLAHVIIVEPNPDVFRAFLSKWDIQEALGVFAQVSLVVNEPIETVSGTVRKVIGQGTIEGKIVSALSLVNYRWHFSEYEKAVHNGVMEAVRFARLNFNTVKAFVELWIVNFWQNFRFGDGEISDYGENFARRPAIIVSAGPSLDKNIHLLEKAKEKSLIIAVGSAISILENRGIKPHFRVAIDPTQENEALFDGIKDDEVPLIYTNHLFYKILPNYHGPKINLCLKSNSLLEQYLYDSAGQERTSLESGFSVANIALNLLLYWKCDPIVFVGQDLAYTEDRLHASGAWDNDYEQKFINKMIEKKDIFGNTVYTDKSFDGMRMVFESIIARNSQTQFLNATEGGIAIKGAENFGLENLLNKWGRYEPPVEDTVKNILTSEDHKNQYAEKRMILENEVVTLKKGIDDFMNLARKTVRYTEDLLERKQAPTNKEARRVARLLKEAQKHSIYKMVAPAFDEFFRMRRSGYLQKQKEAENILPQVRLLYLETNDIITHLEKMKTLIMYYEKRMEIKVIFE